MLSDMERNCVLLPVVKVCFSSHHLWLCFWLSHGTHCYKVVQKPSVIIQEKPGLFPGWQFSELHWIRQHKKKIFPKLMNSFILQGRGSAPAELDQELELSLKWLWSDVLRGFSHLGLQHQSQAHLREDTGVCVRGWEKLLKNIHSHYGSAQIALEGRINNYCLSHRFFPLFFHSHFFSPLLSENSLLFFSSWRKKLLLIYK